MGRLRVGTRSPASLGTRSAHTSLVSGLHSEASDKNAARRGHASPVLLPARMGAGTTRTAGSHRRLRSERSSWVSPSRAVRSAGASRGRLARAGVAMVSLHLEGTAGRDGRSGPFGGSAEIRLWDDPGIPKISPRGPPPQFVSRLYLPAVDCPRFSLRETPDRLLVGVVRRVPSGRPQLAKSYERRIYITL